MYLVPGGVCSGGGIPGPGGCNWSQWGGVPGQVLPPCGQTDASKHITLPQTSFAGGKYFLLPFVKSGNVCFLDYERYRNI